MSHSRRSVDFNPTHLNQEPDPAYDPDHGGRIDLIDNLTSDLSGKTYFEKPKVTKSVMVATLRAHNKLLMIVNQNMENVIRRLARVEGVAKRADEHADHVHAIVNSHTEKLATTEAVFQELNEESKMHKTSIEAADLEIERLKAQVRGQGQMLADDIKAMETSMEEMRGMSNEFMQKLDDLASELELTADKVTYKKRRELTPPTRNSVSSGNPNGKRNSVVSKGGDSLAEIMGEDGNELADDEESQFTMVPLTDMLNHLEDLVLKQNKELELQKNKLKLHGHEIQQRANVLVETDVQRHGEDLEIIKKKVFDQEAVDLMDVRKRQENITESLETIQRDLINKVDRQAVDEKVEVKYSEIINHLQLALKASEDDEEDFKKHTKELYDTVEALRKAKADRRELADLRALLLATSNNRNPVSKPNPDENAGPDDHNATGNKFSPGPTPNAKPNKAAADTMLVTKEELFLLLEDKVDRSELDRRLDTAIRSLINRSRAYPGPSGDATMDVGSFTMNTNPGSTAQMPPPPSDGMWKGLAQALRPMDGGPPPLAQGALAIAKGYTYGRPQTSGLGGNGICLACQSPVVNVGSKALNPNVSLGGGYQLRNDKTGKNRLRTPETLPDLDDRKNGRILVGTDLNIYHGDHSRPTEQKMLGRKNTSKSSDSLPPQAATNQKMGTIARPNSAEKTEAKR